MINKWIKWFITFNGIFIPFAVSLCWKTPQRQSSWSNSFKNNFAFSAQDFKVKRKRCKQIPISWLFFSGIEGFWLSVFKPIATWQLTGYIFIAPAWLDDDKSVHRFLFLLVSRTCAIVWQAYTCGSTWLKISFLSRQDPPIVLALKTMALSVGGFTDKTIPPFWPRDALMEGRWM